MPTVAIEPDTERRPPAVPKPLDFPAYNLSDMGGHESEASLHDLYHFLSSIKKPQDISPSSFQALNLRMEQDVPIQLMVQGDQLASLPPLPWELPGGQTADQPSEDAPRVLMSNGHPYPSSERFDVIRNELLKENDDAFREVARLPPREGRPRTRITQTRKFWAALERMSQYWDTSLDNYYERPATPEGKAGENADKMHTDDDDQKPPSKDPPRENKRADPMDVDDSSAAQHSNGSPGQEKAETPMVSKYTGRRTGAGHEMPEDVREETVRSFAEMAAWPFGCQAPVPSMPPRLTVKSLLFPIRQSFSTARSPSDRQLARKGIMEGPLFVGQCRPETTFREPDEEPGRGANEMCDLYREVGVMLLAAQERAREGATEVRPGEGKWWTTKPRWGGAPNEGIEEDVSNSDEQPSSEPENSRKRSKHGHPPGSSRRPGNGRKLSNSERWKLVQPGPSLWDKRTHYMQIGKNRESPFDDVCRTWPRAAAQWN